MRLSNTSVAQLTKTLPSPKDQEGSTFEEMDTPTLQSRIVLRDTRGEVPVSPITIPPSFPKSRK